MMVSTLLSEIISEVVSDLTTTQMLPYFISACRQVPTLIRDQLLLATDTLIINSGTATGDLTDLSPSFIRERFVWYVDDNDKRQPIVKPPSKSLFHDSYAPNGLGKPDYYRIYQQTIEVDRTADEDLTIGFDYFGALTDGMVLDTNMSINEQFAEAIKFLTKAEYYEQYEEDSMKSERAERKGLRMIQRFEEEYQENELNTQVEDTETY